jgi:hypothetical protein
LENQASPLVQYNNNALKSLCALSYFWTSLCLIFSIGIIIFAYLLLGNSEKFISELRNAFEGGPLEIDYDLKITVRTFFFNFITLIITFIGVVVMQKKNEIGLIIYTIGELVIYLLLFFNKGVTLLALALEDRGSPYSDVTIIYGGVALLFILDILFIYLYYRALEKAKGKLFLNFMN